MIKTIVALALLAMPLPTLAQPVDPYTPESFEGITHPEWSRKAVIYQIREAHPALGNAPWGARMVRVKNSDPQKVFSFARAKDDGAVFVAQNYSAEPKTIVLEEILYLGSWDEKGGKAIELAKGTSLTLAPWSTHVFSRSY